MKNQKLPKIIPALQARTQLGEIINRACYGKSRFIVTRGGKPAVVIMGVEDYENMLEIIGEQLDGEFQADLKEAWADYKAGRVSTLEKLHQDLAEDKKKSHSHGKKV